MAPICMVMHGRTYTFAVALGTASLFGLASPRVVLPTPFRFVAVLAGAAVGSALVVDSFAADAARAWCYPPLLGAAAHRVRHGALAPNFAGHWVSCAHQSAFD